MSNLTLWDIEDSIIGLSEIIESPDASEEEKAAARGELERWTRESIANVDRVRAFLRHCAIMADAAKAEADAMRKRGHQWEERGRRLKEYCITAMSALGKKRLEGQSGVLRIQAAGGKRALAITREDLIPNELCETSVTFRADNWQKIVERLPVEVAREVAERCKIETKPNTEAIRKVLETPCASCGGSGSIEIDHEGDPQSVPCDACAGEGHQIVPGAELAPRADTLRVS